MWKYKDYVSVWSFLTHDYIYKQKHMTEATTVVLQPETYIGIRAHAHTNAHKRARTNTQCIRGRLIAGLMGYLPESDIQ